MSGHIERRAFLKASAAATGGLLLGVYLPDLAGEAVLDAQFGPPGGGAITPSAFIRIGTDETVTLTIHKPDNGQGTETSLAQLLAEELDCDWARVRTEFAPINAALYGGALQGTFGSMAIRTTYDPMRRTGATARDMLVQAAAARWGVEKSQCRTENGVVINTVTNARLTYGTLADSAAKLAVPPNVTLKDPLQFKLIGKAIRRVDTPAKVTGKATFGIDVDVPGMLYAVVARCPVFGGTVARFDATKAKAVAGVTHVVQIPQGVAVVGRNTWAAMQGRRALQVEFDEGPNATLTAAGIRDTLLNLTMKPGGGVAERRGDVDQALWLVSQATEATYEAPYLAHARLEPYACVARFADGGCEVWTGTQIPGQAHSTAVQASGLKPNQVKVHTTYMGGSYGSRGGGAFVAEAVEIAKAIGAPIKLTYSREDELQHDLYRPASAVRFMATRDADGWPNAWFARIACPTWMGLRNGVARESVEGIADYDIPNVRVEYHDPGLPIPTGYWRSVGLSQNTFFAESFLDEMAAAGKKDPVELRRRMYTKSPRLLAVLNLAAEKANWGTPLPNGRFRGIAAVAGFGSFNAQVAEISIAQGKVRVHRVVSAVDCGRVINPTGVVQQAEGAMVYGLSAALRGKITIDRGRVAETNFHQYEPLRMNEMPDVEVHIVPSTDAPGGMGELCTPAIAPAVGNAIFAATGKRIRRLPFSLEELV
ncbi:MAG TPA: xanthine dehydrogenase family protein molybdopterin-binding subunit [Vicinamibacterales bacterium]|nr:xanthine dehydrogenase family protein molybdopterin-binding subunit [Vicinamibacterales bacterium]